MLVPFVRRRAHAAAVLLAIFASFSLVLTGCPLDFGDLEEPEIIDVTVDPSSIHVDERSSQDKHFTIDITFANFEDEIEEARAFIGDDDREAQPENVEVIDDNVVTLEEIRYTWFSGPDYEEVGSYDIGVEVVSATESATAFRQATVTIHDEGEPAE